MFTRSQLGQKPTASSSCNQQQCSIVHLDRFGQLDNKFAKILFASKQIMYFYITVVSTSYAPHIAKHCNLLINYTHSFNHPKYCAIVVSLILWHAFL